MQINLNGKIYIAPAPKGRMVRRAYEIVENLNTTEVTVADLDALAGYIVELYEHQFTTDDVYDGLEAKKLLSTLGYYVNVMTGKIEEKMDEILSPNG